MLELSIQPLEVLQHSRHFGVRKEVGEFPPQVTTTLRHSTSHPFTRPLIAHAL